MHHLIELLKQRRLSRGWTCAHVSTLLGVSHQSISAWERGFRVPSFEDLVRWADVLGVGVSLRIVGEAESPSEEVAALVRQLDSRTQALVLAQVRAALEVQERLR
jgi:transcriptional regulator with XRE-family HTH domain